MLPSENFFWATRETNANKEINNIRNLSFMLYDIDSATRRSKLTN